MVVAVLPVLIYGAQSVGICSADQFILILSLGGMHEQFDVLPTKAHFLSVRQSQVGIITHSGDDNGCVSGRKTQKEREKAG